MAGTVTLYSDTVYPKSDLYSGENYKSVREVVISCVGDASNGTIPDTDLTALTGYTNGSIKGWGFWLVETMFGATAPTDLSDLYLKTEDGNDLLAGAGVNMIKAAANAAIWPLIPVVPIGAKLTIDVDNQAVVSATYKIKLHLVR